MCPPNVFVVYGPTYAEYPVPVGLKKMALIYPGNSPVLRSASAGLRRVDLPEAKLRWLSRKKFYQFDSKEIITGREHRYRQHFSVIPSISQTCRQQAIAKNHDV